MPAEAKPLFRAEALRPRLATFVLPPSAQNARPKLARWSDLLASKGAEQMKESELLPDFITDLFGSLLGYTGPADGEPVYTVRREALIEIDGKRADAAFGRFSRSGEPHEFIAVLEGKGPRDPLDRPFAGRRRSAVEQSLQYAVNLRCDWYLVTNLREIRLYHKGHDQFTYERFATDSLAADEAALRKFVFLLGAERVVPPAGGCHLDVLLSESRRIGIELTRDYYQEYAALRRVTFEHLRKHNPEVAPADLLTATQKILDRVLFIAFCEDRGLLPAESIARAYQHTDPYRPRPIWETFKGLFRAVDEGNEHLGILKYNGGLFAPDELIDGRLIVPDAVCKGFHRLAEYEYRPPTSADDAATGDLPKLIDVEILGHIFEQSITDLEELHREVEGGPVEGEGKPAPSKRKKEGAFYTPPFITRYIVSATLGPVLAERFEALRRRYYEGAATKLRKVLKDPTAFDVQTLSSAQKNLLVKFWEAWQAELMKLRILDPACGSGAFLIEAFDQLFAEYSKANGMLQELRGATLTDTDRYILQHNLFGVDLNEEAVEICRLSMWIKTAQLGKELTSLDRNVQVGNSVVADRNVHPKAFDWKAAFPEIFAAGGFDVVVCNPPYIRQEWISKYKPYLQEHYEAYDGVADLYVYFYELALNLLRPGGRLGFIVTNKWMRAGYGEPLRRLLGKSAWVESVVDFGHAKQIFPDADVFPSILVARKPADGSQQEVPRVCAIPREQLRVDDLSRQIEAEGFPIPRARLGAEPWSLEPPGVAELMEKIRRTGLPLREFAGVAPLYGIKTGFNEAFLMDTPTKERLVAADPKSADLFRPYLRGQDVKRWCAEWTGLWMLAMKSSANHLWPWAEAGEKADAVFQATYPAIHAHLSEYRRQLTQRQDQGQYWWELRACAYWDQFDKPKIMYQDIAWQPRFCLDVAGTLSNNTVYFLPTNDLWVLAVLNSPVAWWYSWRNAQHGKDEALRFFAAFMEEFPVPRVAEGSRQKVEAAVRRLTDITAGQHETRRAFLDWLRVEFGVEKPTQRLQDLVALDADGLIREVKKARGRSRPLSVVDVKRLREEHVRSIAPVQALAAETLQLEQRVSDLVNAAYGLTPEEVALLWRTAPPRMPTDPPDDTGQPGSSGGASG